MSVSELVAQQQCTCFQGLLLTFETVSERIARVMRSVDAAKERMAETMESGSLGTAAVQRRKQRRPRRGHHYIVPHQNLVEVRVQLDATGESRRLTSEDTIRKDHSARACMSVAAQAGNFVPMRLHYQVLTASHKAGFATSVADHDLDKIRNENLIHMHWDPIGWRMHSNKQSQGLAATATSARADRCGSGMGHGTVMQS